MSEFDGGNCNESCTCSKNADMSTCKRCAEEYNMPHEDCCLDFCDTLEFCKGCKNGIHLFNKEESKYEHD